MGGKGQLGLEGERTGLWWHMCRAVDEIRPRWVVAENVANITRTNNGRDFAKSSIRFPDWGTMQNGRLCTLQTQVRPKEEPVLLGCLLRQRPITGGESFFSDVCKTIVKERRLFAGTSLSVGAAWDGQPPVCSVDYGFSDRSLEMYGKSRLKEEVFRAYGNSMCPQLVYNIFRRIEELDN